MALGHDPDAMSSTTTSTTGSQTVLFPTTTASGSSNNALNSQSPTTYYFVFLGVLVVLLIIAASLAYRAYRIRRRFRTATQLALMRGEPPPRLHDDYWALGAMNAWATDPQPADGARDEWLNRRFGPKGIWQRVPVMTEAEVWEEEKDDSEAEVGLIEDIAPISIQSLRPPHMDSGFYDEASSPPSGVQRLAPQLMGPRARMSRASSFLPDSARGARGSGLNGGTTGRLREVDRELEMGEPVRIAVVIKMPRDPLEVAEERAALEEYDEKPGWQGGMQLAVWEGTVGLVTDGDGAL